MKKLLLLLITILFAQNIFAQDYRLDLTLTFNNGGDCYEVCNGLVDTPDCPYNGCTLIEEMESGVRIYDSANNLIGSSNFSIDTYTNTYSQSFVVRPDRIVFDFDYIEIIDLDGNTTVNGGSSTLNLSTAPGVCVIETNSQITAELFEFSSALTQPTDPICNEEQISLRVANDCLNYFYNWRYSLDGLSFSNFGYTTIGPSIEDILLSSVLPANYQGNLFIYAEVSYDGGITYTDDTNTVIYTITGCSPGLLNPPTPQAPLCNTPDNTGSVIVQFDRELDALRNERMLLYIEKFDPLFTTPDQFDFVDGIILDSDDINTTTSNTYTWDRTLIPGRYRLRWISKYDPTDTQIGERTNTDVMSDEFEIIAPSPITFTHSSSNILCRDELTGNITFTSAIGGTGTYEYSINNGTSWQASPSFSGLDNGIYDLLVRDSNNCISQTTAQVDITEPPTKLVIQNLGNVSEPTFTGATDGAITILSLGGTGTISYQWTKDGANYATTTVPTIDTLGAGLYTVIATDANGCASDILEFTLQEPPALSITFTIIQAIDCNGNTGSIRAQGVGGNNASYTYLWQDGSTNQDFLNKPAGTYSVTITDANNVEVTDSFDLVEPVLLAANATSTLVSCNGGTDGTLNVNITGGTPNYTISWNDDILVTTTTRTGLTSGDYFYTIDDTNGCSINGSVTISQPDMIDITIDTVTDPTTVGGTNGAIAVSVSGGTPIYSYQWTDQNGSIVGNAEDISGLTDGNHTLLVTDANNCTATITQRVTEPQPLSVNIIESVSISCPGNSDGQLTTEPFGGDGNYTLAWFIDTNGTFEALGVTNLIVSNLAAGTYRVVVADGTGANAQIEYTLNDPLPIQVSENLKNSSCYGGSDGAIDITVMGGTGNYTFTWTNSSGTVVSNNEDIVDVPSGIYNVSIVDENLCDVFLSFELTAPNEPLAINVIELKDPTAAGATDGFINISVSGGTSPYTYEWTDSSGTAVATSEDLNDVGEGIYTLTVSDANFNLTADNSGCTLIEDIPLLAPDAILIAIDETSSLLCNGDTNGVLTATVTGGFLNTGSDYSYQWFLDDNGTLVDIGQTTAIASELTLGEYTLVVTDDNNIQQSTSYNLNQPNPLVIELTVTSDVSCDSGADGAIDATISGGTGPYTYAWSNGDTTADINGLTVDTYTLTITDANACTISQNIEVIQPDGMTVTNNLTPPLCFGGANGRIDLTVSGGNTPYSYLWNTGATSSFIDNLSAGDYSVTITDNEGCKVIQNFNVENPELLTLDLGEDRVLCAGQSLNIDATIDDLGASYAWSSDIGFTSNQASVAFSEEGIYTLTITNANGCVASDSIAISTTNEIISADFLVPTQAFVDEVIVAVDVSDPVPDAVTWSFDEGTTIVSQNGDYTEFKFAQEGVYTITMTTTKGSCQETRSKQIIVQPRTNAATEQEQQTAFIKTFNLYPNPSNGLFKTKIELKQEAPISIQIINLSANIVNTKTIKQANLEHIISHNLSKKPGTYIILLKTPKGNATKKFVVL